MRRLIMVLSLTLLISGCAGTNVTAGRYHRSSSATLKFPEGVLVYPLPVRRYKRLFYVCRTKYFRIYFVKKDYPLALKASTAVDFIYEFLSDWYGCELRTPYNLYYLPDKEAGYWATGQMHSFGGMIAGKSGTAYIMSKTANLYIVIHELSHLFIGRKIRKPIPRWFDEGLAVYLSSPERNDLFYIVRLCRKVNSLKHIYSWREMERPDFDMLKERGSYDVAASIIVFLARKYGEETIRKTIDLYSSKKFKWNFHQALKECCHIPIGELESEWRGFIRRYAGKEVKPPNIVFLGTPEITNDDAGNIMVMGKVQNQGDGTAYNIKVNFEFKTFEGMSLGKASGAIEGSPYIGYQELIESALKPKEVGRYRLSTAIPRRGEVTYTYAVTWEYK